MNKKKRREYLYLNKTTYTNKIPTVRQMIKENFLCIFSLFLKATILHYVHFLYTHDFKQKPTSFSEFLVFGKFQFGTGT